MHSGDAAKLIVVTLCVIFLFLIAGHERGAINIFSKSYLEDGFCLHGRDGTGHFLAFFFNSVMALVMACLVHSGKNHFGMTEPAMRPIAKNMISLFGHGCGHLFLGWRAISYGNTGRVFEDLSPNGRILALALLYPVWYGFMRDKSRSVATTFAFATFHNVLQVYFLPTRFFFTHVIQAVLFGSGMRWLLRPVHLKTRYYAMEAWLVDVPILMMTFFEALTCDAFLNRFGGHVWFDMVVPFGFIAYWLILVNEGKFAKRHDKEPPTLKQTSSRMLAAISEPPRLLRSLSSGVKESLGIMHRDAQSSGSTNGPMVPLLRSVSSGLLCPRSSGD